MVETAPGGQALRTVEPETVLAAKFSLPHAIAATVQLGTAGARAFTQDKLEDADISRLRKRVRLQPYPDVKPAPNDRPARVTMRFNDGAEISAVVESARGGADKPFDEPTLLSKLAENAGSVFPARARHADGHHPRRQGAPRQGMARGPRWHGEVLTLARELVRALRTTGATPLPEDVATAARLHFLDAMGVGLAAAGSPIGAAYRAYAAEVAKGGPATVFGQATGASAADAAMINGGLIHSLEFDDTHTASIAHGSAVLAAAALAVAEAQNTSGAALLGAYARGWEVLIRFGLAAPNGFHAKGFMSTSVTGALASALMAAELMNLDEIAASPPSASPSARPPV